MSDMTVAKMIDEQIGRGAFFMMGAKQKLADEKSLMFTISGCKNKKWNRIRVTLQSNDLYTVEFIKIGRAPHFPMKIKPHPDTHVEDLHALIERETGLHLGVPRIRGINA